ncbi:MAG: hypothetical protein CM15mP82_4340 [Methanobacteriota archaeon]|nr:MAG: hypothetical protein CM15mP82_4340 [Euryarchaeota archaeon]
MTRLAPHSRLPFDACIYVFTFLPEDHHVNCLRLLNRTRGSCVPSNWPDTGIEVELLSKCNVQAPDAPPTGVVSGPLMDISPSFIDCSVSSGSHSPVKSKAFWPA